MADALAATGAAIFVALDGNIAPAVFSHVPQDYDPGEPVTVIAAMAARAPFGKDDPDRSVSVTLYTIIQGKSPVPVTSAQAEIADILDGAKLSSSGFTIAVHETSRECRLLDDGLTYVGTTILSVIALTA